MPADKRAVLYLRVSTDDQTIENQRRTLLQVAKRKGWTVTAEYADEGFSGALGRDKRPQFDRMLKDAVRSRFDVVMVWAIDRLGRSTASVSTAMDELRQNNVALYADREGMDSTTDFGRAMMQMAAVFAELERSQIKARIRAGLARVKETGQTRSGKPVGRPRAYSDDFRARVADYLIAHGLSETARRFQIPYAQVQRIKLAGQDHVQ